MRQWAVTVSILLLAASFSLACRGEDEFEKLLAEGTSLYARGKEEPSIRHFFRDRRGGVFVDVGCWKPIEYSTTYYLEKHLGWSGIAVDALEHLRPEWEKERPRSRFVWYAVSDKSGETITLFEAGPVSTSDEESLAVWEKSLGQNLKGMPRIVPTITLDDLLEAENIEKIDFLSLDINGTEPAALAGFDIRRFRPQLVYVEAHQRNHEALRTYFRDAGYRRITKYRNLTNWYFTPASQ